MSREIKFRQYVNGKFHYWGFGTTNGKGFAGPMNLHDPCGQYTGLLDRNGKEIYEGDIVQVPERLHMDEGGVVEYSHTGQYVMTKGSFKTSIHEMVFNKWKLEIIGNIHENKDLL